MMGNSCFCCYILFPYFTTRGDIIILFTRPSICGMDTYDMEQFLNCPSHRGKCILYTHKLGFSERARMEHSFLISVPVSFLLVQNGQWSTQMALRFVDGSQTERGSFPCLVSPTKTSVVKIWNTMPFFFMRANLPTTLNYRYWSDCAEKGCPQRSMISP